ncbi:MAG: dTDP-4-dehydrorhamnose 3,5-epimerase, partial [Nitrospiraceae bacterium]
MEGLQIKQVLLYRDQRGWLGEISREDESELKPAMSYLSMTRPGLVRGPHEHREQTDCFCFVGKFRLYFWDNRESSPTYREKKIIDTTDSATVAVVPPGIVHAYKNIGIVDGLVINLPDRLYKGWGKTEPVD